jgi:hypothetical protein
VEELQYADPDVPFLHEMESELDALRAGLEAVDDVEKEDYEGVILPAVEKGSPSTARSGSSTCSATSSNDYEGEAVWGDIKLGARHPPRSSG